MEKQVVSVLTGETRGPFYHEILRGISETLELNKIDMVMVAGDEMGQRHLLDITGDDRYAGAISLRDADSLHPEYEAAARAGFALVLCNAESNIPGVGSVSVGNRYMGELVAKHFLGLGYNQVAVMGNPRYFGRRIEGFINSMEAGGAEVYHGWLKEECYNGQAGYETVDAFLNTNQTLPQAMFCANDELAVGAMDALRSHGVDLPGEIAIVGCDDIQLGRYIKPALTTVEQPKFEMGMFAANLLLRQLSGRAEENLVLNGKLVIRESCGYKTRRRAAAKNR